MMGIGGWRDAGGRRALADLPLGIPDDLYPGE